MGRTIRRALLCTNHLYRFAGSEIVTLELAEDLARRGIAVTIFTHEISDLIAAEMEAAGAAVATKPDEIDPYDHDLIYVQHGLLAPLFARPVPEGAVFPVIFTNHLSPYNIYEAPGPVAEAALADVILANSPETAAMLHDYGGAFAAAEVFANPAPPSFHAAVPPRGADLQRLILVSNHPPTDLLAALDLAEKQGIAVSRIGRRHDVQRVTPDLLAAHDAVVTIGKTAQYALALRRPVFCYDRFGGPGWITASTIDTAAWHNFSGRGFDVAPSPEALAAQIVRGFAAAREFIDGLGPDDLAPYSLSDRLDALLDMAKRLLCDPDRSAARLARLADPEFRRALRGEANLRSLAEVEYRRRRLVEDKLAELSAGSAIGRRGLFRRRR